MRLQIGIRVCGQYLTCRKNGIYKLVQNGESQSDAKAAVSEYLSNNISVSFKAKFEADGKDNAKHEAYIRIKNAENEAIAELSTYCENKSDTRFACTEGFEQRKNGN